MKTSFPLSFLGLFLLWAGSISSTGQGATLFFNGNIIESLNSPSSVANELLVENGKVLLVGHQLSVPPNTIKRDLHGKWVIPAFTDSHAHLLETGKDSLELNLKNKSLLEIKELIQKKLKTVPRPKVITGFGWDQTLWPEQKFPSRHFLDEISSRVPIILFRIDGHAAWANTLALEKSQLLKTIKLREVQNPVVVDLGLDKLQALIPPPSVIQVENQIRAVVKEALALGITGIHDPGISPREFKILKQLIRRENLPFRFYEMASAHSEKDLEAILRKGPQIGLLNNRLTLRTVKLYLDGAMGSRGALFDEPYQDSPKEVGLQLIDEARLENLVKKIDQHGFQVAVHAIGSKANRIALSVFERVLGEKSLARPRIEHAQVLDEDSVKKMGRLGVIAAMQPIHCTSDSRWILERIGKKRARFAYPWKSLLDSKTVIAFGSDSPIEPLNPWKGIYAAITRALPPPSQSSFFPEEKIDLKETLKAYTEGAAFAAFQEKHLGSLSPGKEADFMVLEKNPFSLQPYEFINEKPLETYFSGRLVHQK